MEGLPDISIPPVLSFLRLRDICRCACIDIEWAYCAQQRRIAMKEAARSRAQMLDKEKKQIDLSHLYAAILGNVDEIEALIAHGANIEVQDHNLYTALMRASDGGHLRAVEMLIAQGANLNGSAPFLRTPLMLASWNDHFDVVTALVISGASLDIRDENGNTALQYAIRYRNAKIPTFLIAAAKHKMRR